MALTIRAMKNNLATSERPFYALASWSELVDCDAFIDRMAAGRTTISKTEILAVFQLAREELGRLLAEGCYVKTPFGAALPVARGSFRNPGDPFQPGKPDSGHALRIDFRIDPRIEAEALSGIRFLRDKAGDRRSPRLLSSRSLPEAGEDRARAGGLIRVAGERLKFDPADSRLGLFFAGEAGIEARSEVYALARPSTIVALVPAALPEGEYRLLVRTLSRGGEILEGASAAPTRVLKAG